MRALVAVGAVCTVLAALPPAAAGAVTPVRWCGGDEAQADRGRDRIGGPQVHVVYAIPADGESRFAALASPIATDVFAIDSWWRREDPARAPRFDLFEFPGCESRAGLLDLSSVRVPQPAGNFTFIGGRFERLTRALAAPPFDFGRRDKKYLVLYDGPVAADGVCGTGGGLERLGPSYAVIYLRSTCELSIGDGRGFAYVAAHELAHALGVVSRSAPSSCQDGHVCDSPVDLMGARYAGQLLDEARLDVGRNDYYGHPGGWFDLLDSRWLLNAAGQVALTVRVTGTGVVASRPDDQQCQAACTVEWDRGTQVALAARPAPGFAFAGWSGACAGRRGRTCRLTLAQSRDATAAFRPLRRVAVRIAGRGAVSAAGRRCARPCSVPAAEGTLLALRARAARGWRFVRWTGACRSRRPTCSVRVAGAARVGAVFARRS